MSDSEKLSPGQIAAIADLLWDYLPRDISNIYADAHLNEERRKTGWGTKTKLGLALCCARALRGEKE